MIQHFHFSVNTQKNQRHVFYQNLHMNVQSSLFTTAVKQKQARCPLTSKWMNRTRIHLHSGIFFNDKKKWRLGKKVHLAIKRRSEDLMYNTVTTADITIKICWLQSLNTLTKNKRKPNPKTKKERNMWGDGCVRLDGRNPLTMYMNIKIITMFTTYLIVLSNIP